jgi:hypothetical protein
LVLPRSRDQTPRKATVLRGRTPPAPAALTISQPLWRQLAREGYHSVPDWVDLGDLARALILEKGYRDEDLAEIAREAAIANGMSK